MVYLFERQDESLHIEARFSEESRLYEIIWRPADGKVTRETFSGEVRFRERLDEIKSQLEQEAWHHSGPPELLAGGWKL